MRAVGTLCTEARAESANNVVSAAHDAERRLGPQREPKAMRASATSSKVAPKPTTPGNTVIRTEGLQEEGGRQSDIGKSRSTRVRR
jgi:hypothetical protein